MWVFCKIMASDFIALLMVMSIDANVSSATERHSHVILGDLILYFQSDFSFCDFNYGAQGFTGQVAVVSMLLLVFL